MLSNCLAWTYTSTLRPLEGGHDTCSLPLLCPINMLFTYYFKSLWLHLLLFQATAVSSEPKKPEYVTLPTLRGQAAIQDAWTEQRISNIPSILKEYGVDAWLVRCLSVTAARYLSLLLLSRSSGSTAIVQCTSPLDPVRHAR